MGFKSSVTSLSEVQVDALEHIRLFAGTIRYADEIDGNDANTGLSPEQAFATAGAAFAASGIGDAIITRTGTYDESGLDMNKVGLGLYPEIGTIFQDTAGGTVLTVSANFCRISGNIRISPTGAIGLLLTGQAYNVRDVRIFGATTAFDIQGNGGSLISTGAGTPTVTGYDITATMVTLDQCRTAGALGATRGYWVNGGADYVRMWSCESTGHGTAGFQIDSGSTYCMVRDCASGGGDGDRVDNGANNMWANFKDRMQSEHHEHLYPVSDGEGAAGGPVTVSNTTTDDAAGQRDDQDYWGDPVRIIPVSTITGAWFSVGVYIDAITTSDDQQWQAFFPQLNHSSLQSGGNDWDIDETVLTVADGTVFETDDLVWLAGNDRPNGEILKVVTSVANVVTIVSETRMGGGAGLRYDYDTDASANRLYVVYREDERKFHGFDGAYSAGSAKAFSRFVWHEPKEIEANGGMVMRMLNASDALASEFGARAIYED